ncbi:MAG: hypothetical protein ACTHK2_14285 [Dokdonella sp.]|uniref:hypothetical protein n=1 Tax=Dokdonella sp. TaxID=2291710 RepID=UPI003F7E55D2
MELFLRLTFAATLAGTSVFGAAATPPHADPAYGGLDDGIARMRIDHDDGARDAAATAVGMPDGRLLLGGISSNGPVAERRFAVAMFTADGRPDTSFGPDGSGRFVMSLGDASDLVGVASVDDGNLLVLGSTLRNDGVLVKLDRRGAYVRGFGDGGLRVLEAGTFLDGGIIFRPMRLLPLRGGGILVVGYAMSNTSACAGVARLTEDGAFDASFAGDGAICIAPARTPGEAPFAFGNNAYERDDGRLLIVGSALHASGADLDMFVAQVEEDGSLGVAFGTEGTGFAFVGFGSGDSDYAHAIDLDSLGRIVVAGPVSPPSSNIDVHLGIARLLADGRLDTAFAVDGRRELDDALLGAGSQAALDVRIVDGDRVLVGGWAAEEERVAMTVMLRADGHLDATYGQNGVFRQAAPAAPEDGIVSPAPHSLLLAGDYLYFVGSIPVGAPLPDFSRNTAFAATRYVLPLFNDDFDVAATPTPSRR